MDCHSPFLNFSYGLQMAGYKGVAPIAEFRALFGKSVILFQKELEKMIRAFRLHVMCGSRLGEFAEKLGLQHFAVISRYVETL